MDNYNFIFNEIDTKLKNNHFIINSNNTPKIKQPTDILIDHHIFFTSILNINTFQDLENLMKNNTYDYNFKKYIFHNYLIFKNINLKNNLAIIANIILQNFNIKNKEISYIYKSLKNKKNIIQFIMINYLS
jgi:hypothetical protein